MKNSNHKIQTIWKKNRLFVWIFKKIFHKKERRAQKLIKSNPGFYIKKLFHNPLVVAQVKEELIFDPDYYLGHRLSENKLFFGETNFVSFSEIVSKSKNNEKNIFLNLGDSSTSGWDSRVVEHNRRNICQPNQLLLPFFRYKTYSDFLRQRSENNIIVNAGIPAYSSIQGTRYLSILIDAFSHVNIKISGVTLYFGNNDSCWNGNREDKNLLPLNFNSASGNIVNSLFDNSYYAKLYFAEKMRKKGAPLNNESIIPRVKLEDYINNIETIIILCHKFNIPCIIIKPIVPLRWEPGQRTKGELFPKINDNNSPGAFYVNKLLNNAKNKWAKAMDLLNTGKDIEVVKWMLEDSVENDLIVPRIKSDYSTALKKLSDKLSVPFIDIEVPRDLNEGAYILDYCHPYEPANEIIANKICSLMKHIGKETSILKSPMSAKNSYIRILKDLENKKYYKLEPPEDNYPML